MLKQKRHHCEPHFPYLRVLLSTLWKQIWRMAFGLLIIIQLRCFGRLSHKLLFKDWFIKDPILNSNRGNLRHTGKIKMKSIKERVKKSWSTSNYKSKGLDSDKAPLFYFLFQLSRGAYVRCVCVFIHFPSPAIFQREDAQPTNHPWIQMRCLVRCGYEFVTRLGRELTHHIMSDPYQCSKIHTSLSERPKTRSDTNWGRSLLHIASSRTDFKSITLKVLLNHQGATMFGRNWTDS